MRRDSYGFAGRAMSMLGATAACGREQPVANDRLRPKGDGQIAQRNRRIREGLLMIAQLQTDVLPAAGSGFMNRSPRTH